MFHWIGAPKWALVILIVTLAASALILSYLSYIRSQRPLMTYIRTGGIAGVKEVLMIYPDGRATLQSKIIGLKEIKLRDKELRAAKLLLRELKSLGNLSYEAKQGAADFFIHSISSDGIEVSWVDQWAAKVELPLQLTVLQLLMDKVVREASGSSYVFISSLFCGSVNVRVETPDIILSPGEEIEIKVILENLGDSLSFSSATLNASGDCLRAEVPIIQSALEEGSPVELTIRVTAECESRVSRILINAFAECLPIEVPIIILGSSD